MIQQYNKPLTFYGLSLLIPWIMWCLAGYISHLPNSNDYLMLQGILGILGLVTPVLVSGYLFLTNKHLYNDLKNRLVKFDKFNQIYTVLALGLIFISLVIAQVISIGFGHSFNQFYISGQPNFTSVLFPAWFILLFAPVVEELAWHSYGTDTLCRQYNLFTASISFAVYWVIWHIPLSFIKGYYHSQVIETGWLYGLNFVVSLFVFVILMNWLYIKTKRNILITIVFHLSANVSNELFATHPDSKVIQTLILLLIAIIVVVKEKKLFFKSPKS